MRFISLTVENLGVFRGRYEFDLTPYLPPDEHRNAIVFTGHNGAGKTMLFTALQLALHGPVALGDKVSREEYSEYLFHRLHRFYADGHMNVSEHGSASVKIEYSRSGKISVIEISRYWQRLGDTVQEKVDVACDGVAPDIAPDDTQSWINDFVAPSFLPACFLDAEQLSAMSDPHEYEKLLARNLRRLLGLDLVDRLESDLSQYIRAESRGSDSDTVSVQLKHLEQEQLRLSAERERLHDEETALRHEIDKLTGDIVAAERALAAEGGAFAARRERTQRDVENLRAKIAELEKQLADLAGELLPFALAPSLVTATAARLRAEGALRKQKAAADAVQDWIGGVLSRLRERDFWSELSINPAVGDKVAERLISTLQSSMPPVDVPDAFVHDIGESVQVKLLEWGEQVTGRCVASARTIESALRTLKRELRLAESELASAPPEEVLQPLHRRIGELQQSLAAVERQRAAIHVEVGALEYRLAENNRASDKARGELAQLAKNDTRLELARKSRLALRAYHDASLRSGVRQFEREFVEEFNLLCRKEDLLNAVVVDPDTFRIRFEAASGHVLRLANFSAGERQLAALASLWALRVIAKKSLPLAIDTPLGRLDAIHRESVLNDFLPIVSDQVLLFATDAEIDLSCDDAFGATIARSYQLTFDADRQQTVVSVDDRTPSAKIPRSAGRRSA